MEAGSSPEGKNIALLYASLRYLSIQGRASARNSSMAPAYRSFAMW